MGNRLPGCIKNAARDACGQLLRRSAGHFTEDHVADVVYLAGSEIRKFLPTTKPEFVRP